jgi:membrane protein
MYWRLPNTRTSLRQALPGALVAAALFVAVLRVFPLYVALFGQGFSVYAAFGAVLLFMFWLYIVGVVLVGGAELNAFLQEPERSVAVASLAARALTGQLEVPPAGADAPP